MTNVGGYWREAATVILAVRNQQGASNVASNVNSQLGNIPQSNYNILTLKRSGKSAFMPDRYVFPGGVLSSADFDKRWIKLFEHYTNKPLPEIVAPFKQRRNVVPAFSEPRTSNIPAEIAFRICAIRECFEECGVLLAKKIPSSHNGVRHAHKHVGEVERGEDVGEIQLAVERETTAGGNTSSTPQQLALSSRDLNSSAWRRRVNQDAGKFVSLCLQHGLVPDIWSLREWTNWLTPVMQQVSEAPAKPRRFDTVFYVCCLDDMPAHARVDGRETTVLQWASPAEYISGQGSGCTVMSEPQLYEILRLVNFTDHQQLRTYCREREPQGMPHYLPVILLLRDGIVNILPGDALYPANPDITGLQPLATLDMTQEELMRQEGACVNRTYHASDGGKPRMVCQMEAQCGLVNPRTSLPHTARDSAQNSSRL